METDFFFFTKVFQ